MKFHPSFMGRAAAALTAGYCLAPTAFALELDPNAIENHPIRMIVGIVSLVLAIILILVVTISRAYRKAKRNHSFGSEKTYSRHLESHKKASGGKKQYGRGLLGIFIPSYKGGKSSAGGGKLWASSSPDSHRKLRSGSRGKWRPWAPIGSYKGGKSAAENADTRSELPMSYKEPWGNQKRYGLFHFGFFNLSYKGGKSSAGEGQLHTTSQPKSHAGTRKKKRGGWRPSLPFASYKGGFDAAGEAKIPTPHVPASHRGSRSGSGEGWKPDAPAASYKGGFGGAGEGKVPTPHIPAIHRGRRSGPSEGWKPDAPAASYKGGFSGAGVAELSVQAPASHHGSGAKKPGGWKPDLPAPSYKGGRRSAAGNANFARAFPNRYRATPWGGLRRTRQPLVVPVDSYKGGFAAAKSARLKVHLPKSHRYRLYDPRLTGKTWTITQTRYLGNSSRVRPGQVIQELPLSYKEPWGSKRRYGKVEGGPLYIRMDGSPKPHGRVVQELPMSYKEPWGSQKRYGAVKQSPFPIRMDGSPYPESKVIVELPMSYKEPWGDPKRYGPESPAKFCPPEEHYQGGSTTNPKAPWQNPETGEVFVEQLSDAKRYGNKRYGGKLYAHRSKKYYQAKKAEQS